MTPEETQRESNEAERTQNGMPVVRQLLMLSLVLLAIFSASFVPKTLAKLQGDERERPATELTEVDPTSSAPNTAVFDGIDIRGTSAFVWDVNAQRVLYEKAPDEQLPIASITKLMTALVAFKIIDENADIEIGASAISQDGESGFMAGERFTLRTLADLTLISSSNDGAFAIAAAAGALLDEEDPARTFVEAMNVEAEELGMTQTYFRNPTGLDISTTEPGAESSARDIAFLMEHILKEHPGLLEATTRSSSVFYNENGAYHETENTNYALGDIPGIIGSKTGYTTLAGGNLAVAFDASLNRPIIVVVLGSTWSDRFGDVVKLSDAAREAVQ